MKNKNKKPQKPQETKLAVSMAAAATRLQLDIEILKRAKALDCGAFNANGTVDTAQLAEWLAVHPEANINSVADELLRVRLEREKDKARQERIAADLAEGRVVNKSEGRQILTRCILEIKTKVLGLPKRVSQRLSIENDPIAIEQLLSAEVREVFSDLKFQYGPLACPHCAKPV